MNEQTDIKSLLTLIASRIRIRRKELGLSQEQLAERAGLSHNYLARLELAWNSPTLKTLLSLADALDMHIADIIATDETWSDKGRELAHSLDGLKDEEVEYVTQQFRANIEFLKRQHRKE